MEKVRMLKWELKTLKEYEDKLQKGIQRLETLVLKNKDEGKKAAAYYESVIEQQFEKRDRFEAKVLLEEQKVNPNRNHIFWWNMSRNQCAINIELYTKKVLRTEVFPYSTNSGKELDMMGLIRWIRYYRKEINELEEKIGIRNLRGAGWPAEESSGYTK